MYKFEHGLVRLSDLKPCPHRVTIQTSKLAEEVSNSAASDPERLDPITVAVLGNQHYIVNGHLRAEALAKIGHVSAKANIRHVKKLHEVVRMHIELNTSGSINPVAMMDALAYLRQHDPKGLVSERYASLARGMLGKRSREVVDKFLLRSCKKYRDVSIPFYVIEWLASIKDEGTQYEASMIVTEGAGMPNDRHLVFPTPAGLKDIEWSLRPQRKEKEVVILRPETKSWPEIQSEEAGELVRGSLYNSAFKCRCGRKLLLNTKTHKVSSVREESECIKLDEEVDAKPIFAIPGDVLEFLEGDVEGLRFLKISSRKELDKFASSIKGGARLKIVVILSG